MQRLTAVLCLMLGALAAATPTGAAPPPPPEVNVFLPRLAGSSNLAENVSTILVLRLWSQLQRKGKGDEEDRYGLGRVKWSTRPLPDFDPQTALQTGADAQSRLVLWGSAEDYGSGVVVQANLTVVPDSDLATVDVGTWSLKLNGAEMSLGLPASTFQLAPLILRKDIVARYSTPRRLTICPTKDRDCDGPRLTSSFRAETTEGNWVFVSLTTGQKGWTYLPNISDVEGDLVSFSTGMVCYLRGDFARAVAYFSQVRETTTPGPIRDAVQVLIGLSEARLGHGLAELEQAERLNPYSRYNLQAHVMGLISQAIATPDTDDKRRWLDEALRLVDARRHLFRADDAWLKDVEAAIKP